MKRNQEHYRGCLIGGAVGDAFGSAVEFLSIDAIRKKYGEDGITDHSGDSDSTGSITENILGAYLGMNSIPKEWIEKLELRAVIIPIADDLLAGYQENDQWSRRYPGS